jgi:hypothetical protein
MVARKKFPKELRLFVFRPFSSVYQPYLDTNSQTILLLCALLNPFMFYKFIMIGNAISVVNLFLFGMNGGGEKIKL